MRRLSLTIAMLVGLTLLLWGGVSLQRIFAQERDEAVAALELRQESLRTYGADAIRRILQGKLKSAEPLIEVAATNALLDDAKFLLVSPGAQHLPRVVNPVKGEETPAADLYRQLSNGSRGLGDSGPWGERVTLLAQLEKALKKRDDAKIVAAVRGLLNHRSRFVVDSHRDIPHLIRFFELLVRRTSPDPSLMRGVLKEGLRGSEGPRLVGLQELLLLKRSRFTEQDFDILSTRVTALSRAAGVPHQAFQARVTAQPPRETVDISLPLGGPSIIGDVWYAEPTDDGGARGVAVRPKELLKEAAEQMRSAGLLGPGDRLSWTKNPTLLASVGLQVDSEEWETQREAITRRFRLKSALGVALGGLAIAITILVFVLNRRQRKFLKAKSDFVSAVSHELRTPLASLRVMGETLERRLADTPEAKDFPARIVREADRLGFMVENILSFNRLDRAQTNAHREDMNLSELVEEMQETTAAFTDKPVELSLEGDDAVMRVDPELMKLLFSNLTSNACKYNERDTVKITITGVSSNGHGVTVAVTDNGTGVPEDVQKEVFTEFVRAKGAAKQRGFGLGLAICQRIMQLHDGSIRITDSSNTGTTFELSLPQGRGDDAS